ncbi:MAG: transposase [Candidatus Rokubacteria bacterium]|nr:transposase [Candidatus Rokubacteria bacterium]
MARPIGPKKVHRYSDAFKATAVKLSELSRVQVQDVAAALDSHPFMLSRWRTESREGRLLAGKAVRLEPKTVAELKRLRELERAPAILQEEPARLKKAIKANGTPCVLATVMDVYSRRLVGWALGRERTVHLTERAVQRAIRARAAVTPLIFHSDRGIEYGAYRDRAVLSQHGIRPSMNRPRCCHDNAHMESFFHSKRPCAPTSASTTTTACTPALTTTRRKSMKDWRRESVSTFSGEDHRLDAGRSSGTLACKEIAWRAGGDGPKR